jgi:hypothetical protein
MEILNKNNMITFEEIREKERSSFFYTPIKFVDSINKSLKEIKRFQEKSWGGDILWCVIIFTDGTAVYLGEDLDAIIYFSRLTDSYTDPKSGDVSGFIRDCGSAFIDNGLVDGVILNEAVEMLKKYRLQQAEEERLKEIVRLEEQLKNLKNVGWNDNGTIQK